MSTIGKKGTVSRFDWVNPHMYIVIATTDADGKPALVEGEGVGITQALVDGLDRNALPVGTRVVMRANPNRRTRVLTPAESLEGHWAPARSGFGAAMGAMARWPVTAEARAAQAALKDDGQCNLDPPPVLSVFDELRTIELGDSEIVLRFDNTGDHAERVVHMTAAHPAGVQPSLLGHSIGRWDGETLVIDTIGFEPDSSGLALNVPAGARKHMVQQLGDPSWNRVSLASKQRCIARV